MVYKAKNFDRLYGTPGFSDALLEDHFTLYQGYVKKTNEFLDHLEKFCKEGQMSTPEYMEIKRRFGWEFNGMRLHEYYFGNMTKTAVPEAEDAHLKEKLAADFGSYEAWKKDFLATGATRGIGWVCLSYDPASDRLLNLWINEHDTGHGAGLPVLLIMDVFEHAFMRDYGVKRDKYLDAFFKAIDWKEVASRFHDHRSLALQETSGI